MKFIVRLFYIGLLFIIIMLSGCKKFHEEIIGTWEFHGYGQKKDNIFIWTFSEKGELIRMNESGSWVVYDTCSYEISRALLETRILIYDTKKLTGDPYGLVDGYYRVDRFKNNILAITRIETIDGRTEGAFLRLEFTRIK